MTRSKLDLYYHRYDRALVEYTYSHLSPSKLSNVVLTRRKYHIARSIYYNRANFWLSLKRG